MYYNVTVCDRKLLFIYLFIVSFREKRGLQACQAHQALRYVLISGIAMATELRCTRDVGFLRQKKQNTPCPPVSSERKYLIMN